MFSFLCCLFQRQTGAKRSRVSCERMCWNDHQTLQIVPGSWTQTPDKDKALLNSPGLRNLSSAVRRCYHKNQHAAFSCRKMSLWLAIISNRLPLMHLSCTNKNKTRYDYCLKGQHYVYVGYVMIKVYPEAKSVYLKSWGDGVETPNYNITTKWETTPKDNCGSSHKLVSLYFEKSQFVKDMMYIHVLKHSITYKWVILSLSASPHWSGIVHVIGIRALGHCVC